MPRQPINKKKQQKIMMEHATKKFRKKALATIPREDVTEELVVNMMQESRLQNLKHCFGAKRPPKKLVGNNGYKEKQPVLPYEAPLKKDIHWMHLNQQDRPSATLSDELLSFSSYVAVKI